MTPQTMSESVIWEALDGVKDPEIPVVSVVEMGMIRAVQVGENSVTVGLAPTFSGCPALHVIRADIEACVRELGAENVSVEMILDPPWSSDWISDPARSKLKEFGLAPPPKHGGQIQITFFDRVSCPFCDALDTSVKNHFGPTLCRSIYFCNACRQPFEQLKPL